jgi:pimeloyl-ACP methyl ester carboxylesterase
MMTNSLTSLKDLVHAQFCYQLFITPLPFTMEKKYRDFADMACEFVEGRETEVIHQEIPRHHVIHRFKPPHDHHAKKVLITHGWESRAAYMVCLIRALYKEGYDVYALDFPAHGDSKGLQLPWTDAAAIIRQILNEQGPFYAAIGHSFGGSMLLNTLNLAGQSVAWELHHQIERAVLIASPTQMRNPVTSLARKFKLNRPGYLYLRQLFHEQTHIDPALVNLRHFITQKPVIPFLCIHGENDASISPKESIAFCKEYKKSTLCLLEDANHLSVLMDKRVEHEVCQFLNH